MENETEKENKPIEPVKTQDGICSRVARSKEAHRIGGARAGIAAYCQGNKWLTENARAVGNL